MIRLTRRAFSNAPVAFAFRRQSAVMFGHVSDEHLNAANGGRRSLFGVVSSTAAGGEFCGAVSPIQISAAIIRPNRIVASPSFMLLHFHLPRWLVIAAAADPATKLTVKLTGQPYCRATDEVRQPAAHPDCPSQPRLPGWHKSRGLTLRLGRFPCKTRSSQWLVLPRSARSNTTSNPVVIL